MNILIRNNMLSQSLLRKIAKKMADNPIIGTVCSE
jgi:hypothetical protein